MVSWLMSIKAVLISSGVASVALFLKISIPVAVDFSVSTAPILWSSLLSWLKPPYLYVVTNGIIITIVASSKYYRSHHDRDENDHEVVYGGDYKIQTTTTTEPIVHDEEDPPRMLVVKDLDLDLDPNAHFAANLQEFEPEVVTEVLYDGTPAMAADDGEVEAEEKLKSVIMVENSDLVESGVDDEVEVMLPLNQIPPRMIKSENLPPVSSRIGHRKPVKSNPEGGRRALRVTKPKRNNDTLENTWKMITEGKSTPLTKPLYRRSDTFSRGDSGGSEETKPVYKKSETFRDRTNYYQLPETAKMRKEPSLSQDELNRRVEAFIKKFNEEMKLQRMESLRQYKEITSRGV